MNPPVLKRQIGVLHATLLGLGSILGTGVYFGISDIAAVHGPSILWAILAAGFLASCNALSSAQLAAAHPVSGGTYEYGYRWLTPCWGFTAGWMFLCAKSASAAAGALVTADSAIRLLGLDQRYYAFIAVGSVIMMTLLVLCGLRRSAWTNSLLVAVTVLGLGVFCLAAFSSSKTATTDAAASSDTSIFGLFQATALMFVAYTGYGRVATLGEEIREPRRNIPRAIISTLVVSVVLYLIVGLAVLKVGRIQDHDGLHSLPVLGQHLSDEAWMERAISIGAMTAMMGVLLNLVLGLSRVVLSMGRRGDLPRVFSRLNRAQTTPIPAVILVGLIIGSLTLAGNARNAWSLSAMTVLIYYGITNFAACRLGEEDRQYPRWISVAGLVGCLSLATQLDLHSLITGGSLLIGGGVWHAVAVRLRSSSLVE